MKITVTTATQTLYDIIVAAGLLDQANYGKTELHEYKVALKPVGVQAILIEFGDDATVANGYPVPATGMAFGTQNLGKVNLISDGANNVDVRIAIT